MILFYKKLYQNLCVSRSAIKVNSFVVHVDFISQDVTHISLFLIFSAFHQPDTRTIAVIEHEMRTSLYIQAK